MKLPFLSEIIAECMRRAMGRHWTAKCGTDDPRTSVCLEKYSLVEKHKSIEYEGGSL